MDFLCNCPAWASPNHSALFLKGCSDISFITPSSKTVRDEPLTEKQVEISSSSSLLTASQIIKNGLSGNLGHSDSSVSERVYHQTLFEKEIMCCVEPSRVLLDGQTKEPSFVIFQSWNKFRTQSVKYYKYYLLLNTTCGIYKQGFRTKEEVKFKRMCDLKNPITIFTFTAFSKHSYPE